MTIMAQINHADLAFFDRLAALTSDRRDALPPRGTFFTEEAHLNYSDHGAQYEHMTDMTGIIGCDVEDDYLFALEHIVKMAEHDDIRLRTRDILYATGRVMCIETAIAVGMVLGALVFVSMEWLVSLLPI